MFTYVRQVNANENTTNNTKNAPTFLKSNYKYKRRCRKICLCVQKWSWRENLLQSADRMHSGSDRYCVNAKNTHYNKQIIINHNKSENSNAIAIANVNANAIYNKCNNIYECNQIICEITLILRLFITFIVGKALQWRRDEDVIKMQQQRRNYDKLSALTLKSTSTSTSTSTSMSVRAATTTSHQLDAASKSYDSYNKYSNNGDNSGRCGSVDDDGVGGSFGNRLQLFFVRWQREAVASIDRCRRVNALSTLTALLFMTLAFNAPHVQAGACWRSSNSNGKCSEIYLRNSTKAECCKYPELFYTDRDIVDVEFFFATTAGNGLTCSPCIESCKNMQCDWNKKCVKRKGRPKCVCAPECGGAARRRRQRDQKKIFRGHQQHSEELRFNARLHQMMGRTEAEQTMAQEPQTEQQAELVAESKSPRDIRSLSSEITNINLGVAPHQMQSQNQRKMLQIMQSQQSQQKPQSHRREPKTSRLLITASNVEQSSAGGGGTTTTTTRRLQVLSNVRGPHNANYDDDRDSESADSYVDSDADADADVDADANTDESEYESIDDVDVEDDNEDDVDDEDDIVTDNAHDDVTTDAVTVNNADAEAEAEADQRADNSRTSRHKANKNRRRHEHVMQHEHMANGSSNFNDSNSNNHSNVLLRHMQQHVRRRIENAPNRIKASADDDVDADDSADSRGSSSGKQQRQHRHSHQQQQQQHQRQRKRKQHQSQHSHNHRSKKQKKLKDHNANNNGNNKNAHTHHLYALADSSTPSVVAVTAAHDNFDAVAAAPNGNVSATLLSTSLSAEQRLFNRGSHQAKSSTTAAVTMYGQQQQQQELIKTAQSSEAFQNGAAVDVSKSSVNSVDSTLLDGIYDNFNVYGFPNRQYELMFEHLHGAHPVCGTDGRTYNTECQLKKRACRTDNPTLAVAYRGHCRTTCSGVKCLNGLQCVEDHYTIPHCIACKIDCDETDDIAAAAAAAADDAQRQQRRDVIDPARAVCGVDGKTYKSVCDINRMICKIGRSIAVAYPGPCRADRVTCADINCGSRHTCLVDLLTHEPRCVSCRYKCARKRRPSSLRFEEGKICGVNNRTYNSWCEMRKDSCNTGFFIDVKSAGACH